MARVVKEINSRGWQHNNLKLDNFLLDDKATLSRVVASSFRKASREESYDNEGPDLLSLARWFHLLMYSPGFALDMEKVLGRSLNAIVLRCVTEPMIDGVLCEDVARHTFRTSEDCREDAAGLVERILHFAKARSVDLDAPTYRKPGRGSLVVIIICCCAAGFVVASVAVYFAFDAIRRRRRRRPAPTTAELLF